MFWNCVTTAKAIINELIVKDCIYKYVWFPDIDKVYIVGRVKLIVVSKKRRRPLRLKKKSILENFLQSFFFMLKIKNSQKRRNINISKSLMTCYLSQTSSIFYIFRSLSTFWEDASSFCRYFKGVNQFNNYYLKQCNTAQYR